VFQCVLERDKELQYTLPTNRAAYIHVPETNGELFINDVLLKQGDGAFIPAQSSQSVLNLKGRSEKNEFILIDVTKQEK